MNFKLSMAATALSALFAAQSALAQTPAPPAAPAPAPTRAPLDTTMLEQAGQTYLGYVRSPVDQVNSDTEKGLEVLKGTITKRTTVDPAGVVAIDLAHDDISTLSFIYWPVTRETAPLSEAAQKNLQTFISTGGLLLIDVCDQSLNTTANQGIRPVLDLLGGVRLKPLSALPEDHTVTRSHYLVPSLQGSSDFGTVWVEAADPKRKENVTSVIIGENNWAAAWAAKTLPEGSREHEMSLRVGINMIMFSMTGNYKADQVHVPALLQRLEK